MKNEMYFMKPACFFVQYIFKLKNFLDSDTSLVTTQATAMHLPAAAKRNLK